MLKSDLSHSFSDCLPVDLIESKARAVNPKSRDCVFTPVNVILTMLLTAIQEDKSIQNGLNLFKSVFESDCLIAGRQEEIQLAAEKLRDSQMPLKAGRPRLYRSRLPGRCQHPISARTGGYSLARKNLNPDIIREVYTHSTDFGDLDRERWHGMKTFLSDGTYIQLQDTDDIKSRYPVTGKEDSYPQALLQVMIRQGSGQISQYASGSRNESELRLIIPMIRNLEANSLLLADDLYNTYYHFCLILSQECHMIVPGKRDRNYKVVRQINSDDQIVEISKTVRPAYVSKEEWDSLPDILLLRRITYNYPTKNGMEAAVLYTTVLNGNIRASEIITKYAMRRDIEICIREIKTLMDISVLRSKSCEMTDKELMIALTAYNMLRKIIAESADAVGFPPRDDLFQKCAPTGRPVLLDKRGRVFYRWSPGRYGYATDANRQSSDSASKRKTTALHAKNKKGEISKI
jgi:hypothetical protein